MMLAIFYLHGAQPMSPTGTSMQCQPRTFSWTRMLTNACAYALTSPLEQSTVQVKTIRCMYASILSFLASKHCKAKRRCCAYLGFQQPISRWSHNGCTPFHVLIQNSRLTSLCLVLWFVSQHVWLVKDRPSGAAPVGGPASAANAGDQPRPPQPGFRNPIPCGWWCCQSMPWSRVLPGMLP